jgi:hypothetical protein
LRFTLLAKETSQAAVEPAARTPDDRALYGKRSGLRQGEANQGLKPDP